jgi:predicted nuclease with TOPRIM domain
MEQELLQQILQGITDLNGKFEVLKEDVSILKGDVSELKAETKRLDEKIDNVERRINEKVDGVESRLSRRIKDAKKSLTDEMNLHGRYILEDVGRVRDKLDRVITQKQLVLV